MAFAFVRLLGYAAAGAVVFFYFLFVAWYWAMRYLIGPILAYLLVRILV
jgi:hypothetical protein